MKQIAAVLATVGILATASAPALATASTLQNHSTLSSTAAANSVIRIAPHTSASSTWGTTSLTHDDASMQFHWTVTPKDSRSYTYYMQIDYYQNNAYIGSSSLPVVSGTGALSGYADYPSFGMGTYNAKLSGTWQASDGTCGSLPAMGLTASGLFNIGM